MEVVASCPMHALGFVWQTSAKTFAQTIVVKATFLLEPGHAKLAPREEWVEIHEKDQFVKGDTSGILFAPTDRVPYKPRVDVMLVGHAHAPGKHPVRSLVTKLEVGDFAKNIEVVCDRGYRSVNERLVEGPHFTKMSLDWSRAAGGPGTTNPAGKRFETTTPDGFVLASLPNLQPPRSLVTKAADTFAPIGYGPIAPTWPERIQHLERHAATFSPANWDDRPLPENFDFAYFQAAPPDQRIEVLHSLITLVLENLHSVHARLVTQLPDVCPRAVVQRSSGEREDVTLVADTLWIDTDRSLCCVVWRGNIGLRHPTETGVIGVVLVEPEIEAIDENVVETIPQGMVDEDDLASMTMVAPFGAKPKGPAMPFVGANLPARQANPVRSKDDGALPFGPSGLSGLVPAPIAMGQITLPAQSPTSSPTVPDIVLPATPRKKTPLPVPPPPPPRAIAVASTTAPSLWVTNVASEPVTEREIAPPIVEIESQRAASELVQLVWSGAHASARLRDEAAWTNLLGARVCPSEPHETQDREDVFEVLVKGSCAGKEGLDRTFAGAIAVDGKFVPPLVLVAAEVEFYFDELERLKATMSAALPLITSADTELGMAVATAKEFVRTPGLSAAAAVGEGLTRRIREAFVREKKGMSADSLEMPAEQVLLTGRHHQRREVFGGLFVRCGIWLSGETSPIVGYLPAKALKKLPMWRRFRARLLAELHPAQEQSETGMKALKIVALARVVDIKTLA